MINIAGKRFKIIVKPNSRENRIISFNEEKNSYLIGIKSKPKDNKANIEAIKFLSRLLKKKVKIASGLKSREKLVEVLD